MNFTQKALIMLMILIAQFSFAQQNRVQIVGSVVEKDGKTPIEQATVRLLNSKDSSMVKGIVSNQQGKFTLKDVRRGNYLLNVSYVGYESAYLPLLISGKKSPILVGKITLNDEAIALAEAVVIGKATEIVVRNDTIEYNADSYKVTEGSVLEDLLKKMPGVEIASDGKIKVNGKEVKKIMVDGKEFFSNDPKVASKNLPAKMIDKLQVLDKKSDMAKMTGFDDDEEETIINLTVKKNMKQGWFGNAYGGYGNKDRYEGEAMVNRFVNNDQFTFMGGANNTNNMGFSDLSSSMFSSFGGGGGRRGGLGAGSGITSSGNAGFNFSKEFSPKFIWGGNTQYSHVDNDARSKSERENILPGDSSSYEHSKAYSRTKSDNFAMDFRMEWKPDSLTQIIFTPQFSYSHSRNHNTGNTTTLNHDRDTVNTNISNNQSESNGYDLNANLHFSRKLNAKGRVFSMRLSGGNNDSYSNGMDQSDVSYFNAAGRDNNIDQRSRYDNKGFKYRVYLSWVEPIGHNNFIQATYSVSQRKQEALKNVYNKDKEGIYSALDSAYSQSYRNNFVSQRASLSFKSVRRKFNYTIGLNLDPSYTKSENFVGDTTLSTISRKVINLSPKAQLKYSFDRKTNLRVIYQGRTSQPSMTQLQPVADISNPTHIKIGNPDLNPRYINNLAVRFHRFIPQKQQALMIMANVGYIMNDIVNYTSYNPKTGVRTTTYKNVNGNYNANVHAVFNTPLKNKKFSFNSFSMLIFANQNGFINEQKNTNRNLIANERAGLDFRSSYIDLGINGRIRYNATSNSFQKENDQRTFDYSVGGRTTIHLPLNFKIESDVNWSTNSGYGDDFKLNEVLWNASASKSFLKNNQGTLRFKIYDILQQRSNISRSVTASHIQDSEYNTLGSYFMFHFIYRFNIFKGGATQNDMQKHPNHRYKRRHF